MPYKLSSKGRHEIQEAKLLRPSVLSFITLHQALCLNFLMSHEEEGYVESSKIAQFYNMAPQAMRGPCASLYRQGLIDKKEP